MARGLATLAGAEAGEAMRRRWIDATTSLLETAERLFADGRGGWFDASADGLLPLRARSVDDGAMPSGATAMVGALRRIAELLDSLGNTSAANRHRVRAAAAIRASSHMLVLNPLASMGQLAELGALRRAEPGLV